MKKFFLFLITILIVTISFWNPLSASEDWGGNPSSSMNSGSDNGSGATSGNNDSDDSDDGFSGPPGGDSDSGTSVATLVTPATLTPSPTVATSAPVATTPMPTNHPFADFYSSITMLQGVLLESINTYWTATNPPQPASGISFSNLPSSVNAIMQGSMGNYFGSVFMPGSLPLQILMFIKKQLLTYVKGMTNQLTVENYASSMGNDFVTFTEPALNNKQGTFTGNLAYVDQLWNNTINIITTTFSTMQKTNKFTNATIKFISKSLTSITNDYTEQRYQTIIRWYTHLINTLANRYNPTKFSHGFFSYTVIPSVEALTGYSNAFIDACNQLNPYYSNLTTSASFSLGSLLLSINQKAVTPSSTVFTDPATFFSTIQTQAYNHMGDICAYTTSLGLQRASDRVENKTVPTPITPTPPTYNALQDIPTFLTSTQTGAATQQMPFFAGTQLPASPDFYTLQGIFSAISGYTIGALDAFNFTTPSTGQAAFLYDSLSPLVTSTYADEGLKAPSNMLATLSSSVTTNATMLQNVQNRVTTATSKTSPTTLVTNPQQVITSQYSNVGDVFQELLVACNAALNAQYWYNLAGNGAAESAYSIKASLLEKVVSDLKNGCTLLANVSSQPDSQSYATYTQAGNLFADCASNLLTLNLFPLNSYTMTLAAYVKITAYQALLSYYSTYYASSLTTYNKYLKTAPSYTYLKGQYTFDVVPGYESALFTIVYHIDQAISAAIQGYQNQLSFFLSQSANDPKYLSLIWPIQDALLLLSNFQEGITPLLLQMPCATTANNQALLCGVDYNLIESTATTVAEKDIAALIIKAHDQYIQTYPLFKAIDKIMTQYDPSTDQYKALQSYTCLDNLFQLSDNKLTFSEFFLLHQARLYTSVAQRLIEGKPFFWNEGDAQKKQGSPYALLLYTYAAAIYQNLGYTQNAQTVNAMKHLLFSPAMIASFKDTVISTLQTPIAGMKHVDINQMFQELNALSTVLYVSPGDKTQFQFLQMLSKSITDEKPAEQKTLGDYGYADWLATGPDSISYPHLKAALMYYQGYLIAQTRQDVHAQAFLQQAEIQFTFFIKYIDEQLKKYNITNDTATSYENVLSSASDITVELAHIKSLIDAKDAYDYAIYQMKFLQEVFAPTVKDATVLALPATLSSEGSQFFTGTLNLPGIIGDIYQAFGNKKFSKLQSGGAANLTKDLTQEFKEICNYYTESKNYYAIAAVSDKSYQKKFLATEYALTDTYAYQNYNDIIPCFSLKLPGVKLPQKSPLSIPVSVSLPSTTLKTAAQTYTVGTALYLYKKLVSPVSSLLTSSVTQNSTDSLSLMKSLAAPSYSLGLSTNIADSTTKDTVQGYVDDYTNTYTSLCTKGLTLNGQTLHGSIAYNALSKLLTLNYQPIPPLPRFNHEIYSAIAYYSDGCSKLYASNSSPINYHNQILIPSNNLAGQDLSNNALFNTYLTRGLDIVSNIETLKKDPQYLALKKLFDAANPTPSADGSLSSSQVTQQMAAVQTLMQQNFYDALPVYKEMQPYYEELIGLYMGINSFLSNYGISSTLCSEIIASTIIEWMKFNRVFICGVPDMSTYSAVLHNLEQSTQQVQQYAHEISDGERYISNANLIFASAYGYCAQAYTFAPATTLSTPLIDPISGNPDPNNTPYPNIATTKLPACKDWKNAGSYNLCAGKVLQSIINENPSFSLATQKILNDQTHTYYEKAINNYLHYATYQAALFCSYAFQECRCSITPSGGLNIVTLPEAGLTGYPSSDYPLTGALPGTPTPVGFTCTSTTCYSYPVCESIPSHGVTYTASMPDTLYQGVASMEMPIFAFAKNQSSDGQVSPYSAMYTTMQQIMLNALYHYELVLSLIKKVLPTTKISPAARKARQNETRLAINAWIIKVLNEGPGFYNPKTKEGTLLPTIMIPTSSAQKVVVNGRKTRVTQFVNLIACSDIELSLANNQQFYIHTLRYWSSQPNFYQTLLDGLLQWCKEGSYDMAQVLLNDVFEMFQAFFIRSYLSSASSTDAQYQAQQMIQNSQEDSTQSSSGYF